MLLESQGVPKSELMSLSELTAALAGRASDRREKPQEWKWLDVGDDVRIAVAPFGTSRVVVVLQKGTIMPVIGEQLSLHEARWIGLRMVEAALMVAEYGHQ